MKYICLACLLICLNLSLYAQKDAQDLEQLFEEMDVKIEEMMKQFEGGLFQQEFLSDSLFVIPFGELKGEFHLHDLNAQNIDEMYTDMMQMIQMQMQSLGDQDWQEFEQFFDNFKQMSPDFKQNAVPEDQKPIKPAKKRKSVDL